MRTIKFRGKRLHNGKWVCGYLSDVDNTPIGKVGIINSKPFSGCEESTMVIAESIGQFTGLHDKNGNEIYEGDIVSIEAIKSRINKVVEWNSERACWDAGGENRIDLYAFCYCEVIGNIYDNSELLEGGEE